MRVAAVILVAAAMLALAPAAGALEGISGYFGSSYPGAQSGQLDAPAGVAVDERTGDVYVADSANNRVEEFSASGAFIRTWGEDSAVAGGMSDPQGVAVDQSSGDVYVSDEGNLRVDEFNEEGRFIRVWGAGVVASGPGRVVQDAQQTVTVNASGGTFTLTFGGDTTAAIAYDAPAAGPGGVQKALEGLASIGAGDVAVGGGDGGPYTVTFRGTLENTNVPAMTADGSDLTGPGAGVSVTTVTVGDSAAEVCTGADVCQAGVSAANGGAFAATFDGFLAVAPAGAPNAGDVIVADPGNARVQEFTSTGLFVRAFGGNVNRTASEEHGAGADERDLCTAVTGDLCQAGTPGGQPGEFAAGTPTRIAVDSSGAIYTVESSAGFRVQKLTPANGGLSASVFASAVLGGSEAGDAPTDVAVDPQSGTVYVVKGFPLGAGEPAAVMPEKRLLAISATGAPLGAGLVDEAIGSVNGLALGGANGRAYVSSATLGQRVYVLEGIPTPAGPPFSPCPNEALREESNSETTENPSEAKSPPYSTELPDCRSYEQVTPSYTDGYTVLEGKTSVSEDGSRVIDATLGVLAGAEASQLQGGYYEFERTPSGWTATPLNPPAAQFPEQEYADASPTTGATLWELRPASESLLRQRDIYTRALGGALSEVGPMLPPSAPAVASEPVGIVSASADFSHVFFELHAASGEAELWPFDSSYQGIPSLSLYEYTGAGNTEPELVGVSGGRGSDALISQCGTSLGSAAQTSVYNAVSTSGETVFFTAEHSGACPAGQPPVSELYARVAREKTLDISEPALPAGVSCTGVCAEYRDETGGHHRSGGAFDGASEDGSRVFFETTQPLVNGDEDAGNDLYMAEIDGAGQGAAISNLAQVSHDPNAGQPAEVQGVARISADGSHVYFVAKGVLTGEANGLGQTAELGKDNLYVYDTGTQRTAFVATLLPADETDWKVNAGSTDAQATPDGGFLVFPSSADPTREGTGNTMQVYLYDASTGTLQRVSIGQQGEYECPATKKLEEGFNCDGATGAMKLEGLQGASAKELRTIGGRAISADGSRVFFTSTDGLTPGAENKMKINSEGKEALNVYEWEADGSGTCRQLTGCVSLLSEGHDTHEETGISQVAFVGTDASGDDAFLETAIPLTPSDTNLATSVYDARAGGGFPAPVQPASCAGEGCQPGEGPAAPAQPSVDSQAFTSPGALAPVPTTGIAPAKGKAAAPGRAVALARALKVCHRVKKASKRRVCEAAARRRYYGPKPKPKPKARAKRTKIDRRAGR